MAINIREDDIDYDEIVYKLTREQHEAALANVTVALAELSSLKSDDPDRRSNEVYRALSLVHVALVDSFPED